MTTKQKERAEQDRERLREAVAALSSEEGFRRWLEVKAAMWNYSLHNSILIALQRPSATLVRGFRQWQAHDRQVMKGEKGIRILAPRFAKVEDEETGEKVRRRIGFIGVSVFDVEQTEGEPLAPPEVQPVEGDSHADRLEGLEEAARELGYEVTYRDLASEHHGGYCNPDEKKIVVNSGWAPNAQVRVLTHEIGHALGIGYADYGREVAEVIVDAATAIACRAAGLDVDLASVPYIAGWAQGDPRVIETQAALIDQTARTLIGALQADEVDGDE